MQLILSFIVRYLSDIWDRGFKIEVSHVAPSNAGNAVLTLKSDHLLISFVCDRRQVTVYFSPIGRKDEYSIDLIRRHLLGERETSAVLDEGYGEFLLEHLPSILALFEPPRIEDSIREFNVLKRTRSREMFG